MRNEPKYIGGMMRCCAASIDNQREDDTGEPEVGMELTCEYCKSKFAYIEGRSGPGWQWDNYS